MKKYLLVFILFSIAGMIYLQVKNDMHSPRQNSAFASIVDNKIHLNGIEFYPIALNYMAAIQSDKNLIWASPYRQYFPREAVFQYDSKDSCLLQLKADMELIKEMGFNTVRLVVFGEERINKKTGEISIYSYIGNENDTLFLLSDDVSYERYLRGFSELISIVSNAGLKAIPLVPVHAGITASEEHFKRVADHFKNDTTIIAYDLFNEPLYFDSLERTKKEVHHITESWKKMVRKYAPNHLYTIGLTGIREVFEWDPNILEVDFLSIHPYEYEPEQVRNEMHWYSRYIKKPWLIGETAIPADGDSVKYEAQSEFARKTLKQAYNCGAIGYTWWQYKDVDYFKFHANYMGIVNKKGETKTASGNIVKGTPKPVSEEFKQFSFPKMKEACICLGNYYNYSQHTNFRLKGILKDENDNPIEGGVILAWNQWWSSSYHTVTRADGSFELSGDFPFYHWMASATLHSMVRGEILPDTVKNFSDIPTGDLGTLKINKLLFLK